MKRKVKIRQKTRATDPAKEKLVKSLILQLQERGLKVRREELKRGQGWRAKSGQCTVTGSPIVFLDSRLSQNDQIDFLNTQLSEIAA
jgi:hypothetical protein